MQSAELLQKPQLISEDRSPAPAALLIQLGREWKCLSGKQGVNENWCLLGLLKKKKSGHLCVQIAE